MFYPFNQPIIQEDVFKEAQKQFELYCEQYPEIQRTYFDFIAWSKKQNYSLISK